jgi:hypothetical protein
MVVTKYLNSGTHELIEVRWWVGDTKVVTLLVVLRKSGTPAFQALQTLLTGLERPPS